jgi:Zn-dependent M28 family amino/carboxypeptidase
VSQAQSQAAPGKLTIRNTGTRRVVIGPPAKSKRDASAAALIKFDTDADEAVPKDKRIGTTRELTGAAATAVRGSKTVQAMGERLGLRMT